ncbi:hypothetical protein F5882DRAFT_460802 [Hyaloscypha sp. PMI_1271]|nr:hypothetical protein F5882DRAFT_460802 [Hyaloscypha sp. PMI_1271]
MDISTPLNPSNLFSANGPMVSSSSLLAAAAALAMQLPPRLSRPVHPASTSLAGVSLPRRRCQQPQRLQGWEATFAVNSSAVLYVSAAFLKLLDAGNRRRGWEGGKLPADRARRREKGNLAKILIEPDDERTSQIITVGSISGLNRFITAGLAYSCSKAAAIHLCKMLAYLLAPWGIRSNVINPGVYPSVMTTGSKDSYNYKEVPAGRKGSFQDIAGVVLYLVGKGGAYVNGSMENTDGGMLSVMPATY